MLSSCCLYISPYQLLNACTNLYETWYAYRWNWAHLNGVLHKTLPSVCVCMCIDPVVAKQRLGRHVSATTNTRHSTSKRIVWPVIFYAVRVLLKESLWVCLCIPLSLLGKTLGNNVAAATKNCWRCRFLRGPWRIDGKWAISSSWNVLL
jgi:hypothetical protein